MRTLNETRIWIVALVLVALAAGLIFLYLSESDGGRTAQGPQPLPVAGAGGSDLNVILITIDTLRADRLGCYGSKQVFTPAIDRLASEGVRFTNAATTVPFTLPAHSSMMTGTYPPYHGVRENVGYFLDESIPTLAEQMKLGGWTTAGFVSAFVLDSRWGIARGFDTYFDDFDLSQEENPNLGSVQRDGRETVAEAVRWLDSRPSGKFFLWLHLFDPHDPYTPPEPFRSEYPGRPYDAEVAYTDSLVGEFRQALEDRRLLARTLLILTGDHGEGLGQHRERSHGFFLYESTTHVPLIMRFPNGTRSGEEITQAVSHVDLLPTILQFAGREVPADVQGSSLLTLLQEPDEAPQERYVYSESLYPLLHYGWAALRSIRGTRFKFIDAPQPELYDVVGDGREQKNLLLDERRTSRQMKDRLAAMLSEMESAGRGVTRLPEIDDETLAQLEALGYLAGRGGVALEEEDDILRADPKDRIELHQLVMAAQTEIGRGEEDTARDKLQRVLATDPTVLDAHQMLGSIANRQEQFAAAVPHFQEALALQGDHAPSIFGLAYAFLKLEREDDALVGFQRVLELSPNDTRAAVALVDILVAKDRVTEAIDILQTAAAREDAPAALHNQLGELWVLAERPVEAKSSFERAAELGPRYAEARFNLAVLLEEEGRLEEALTLYEEVLELSPKHYKAQFNLGRLYGQRGNLDRQQELYAAALASNPEFVRGYYFLAKLLMDRGSDLARAEELTREGLSRDSDHRAGPLGYYLLADILNRTGRRAEAAQAAAMGQKIQKEQQSDSG
jgi:arylsulfatase A-like enzyme/Tfp pilus assembly protein PilF